MRSDTPTGIGTAAWSAPQQMWAGLLDAIRRGLVVVQDPQAWQMLAEKIPGTTPQSVGGAALTGAQPGAVGAGGIGTGGDGRRPAGLLRHHHRQRPGDASRTTWLTRTGSRERGTTGWPSRRPTRRTGRRFEQAQFPYKQTAGQWNLQQSAGFYEVNGQRQPTLAGIAQEAGLTGYYNGKPTFAREQHQDSTMMGLLALGANAPGAGQLRGLPSHLGRHAAGDAGRGERCCGAVRAALAPAAPPRVPPTTRPPCSPCSRTSPPAGPAQQQEWSQALSGGLPAANQFNLR